MFRCRLSTGDRGELKQASTVVLIECQLDPSDGGRWELGAGCHLLLLDCTLTMSLQITLDEGATVIAPGHQVLRDDLNQRVTIIPTDSPCR